MWYKFLGFIRTLTVKLGYCEACAGKCEGDYKYQGPTTNE